MGFIIEDRNEFKNLILEGYTIAQLQKYYACSRTAVTEAKKRFGLVGISPNSKKRDNGEGTKICNLCHTEKPLSEFHSNGYYKGKKKLKPGCKPCESSKVLSRQIALVVDILKEQGRECACELCGYKNNYAALCFHHKNPEDKDFEISRRRNASRDVLAPELAKCALLCHNCHMEIHYPIQQI